VKDRGPVPRERLRSSERSRLPLVVSTGPLVVIAGPLVVIAGPLVVSTGPLVVIAGPLVVFAGPLVVITGLDPVIRRGTHIVRGEMAGSSPAMTVKGSRP
jgi:hypothetical protein